jgi:tetratricopeptide (TPR) repeat protein
MLFCASSSWAASKKNAPAPEVMLPEEAIELAAKAQEMVRQRNYTEAIPLLERMLRAEGTSGMVRSDAAALLAWARLASGSREGLMALMPLMTIRQGGPRFDLDCHRLVLEAADQAYADGRYSEALVFYSAVPPFAEVATYLEGRRNELQKRRDELKDAALIAAIDRELERIQHQLEVGKLNIDRTADIHRRMAVLTSAQGRYHEAANHWLFLADTTRQSGQALRHRESAAQEAVCRDSELLESIVDDAPTLSNTLALLLAAAQAAHHGYDTLERRRTARHWIVSPDTVDQIELLAGLTALNESRFATAERHLRPLAEAPLLANHQKEAARRGLGCALAGQRRFDEALACFEGIENGIDQLAALAGLRYLASASDGLTRWLITHPDDVANPRARCLASEVALADGRCDEAFALAREAATTGDSAVAERALALMPVIAEKMPDPSEVWNWCARDIPERDGALALAGMRLFREGPAAARNTVLELAKRFGNDPAATGFDRVLLRIADPSHPLRVLYERAVFLDALAVAQSKGRRTEALRWIMLMDLRGDPIAGHHAAAIGTGHFQHASPANLVWIAQRQNPAHPKQLALGRAAAWHCLRQFPHLTRWQAEARLALAALEIGTAPARARRLASEARCLFAAQDIVARSLLLECKAGSIRPNDCLRDVLAVTENDPVLAADAFQMLAGKTIGDRPFPYFQMAALLSPNQNLRTTLHGLARILAESGRITEALALRAESEAIRKP